MFSALTSSEDHDSSFKDAPEQIDILFQAFTTHLEGFIGSLHCGYSFYTP